MKPGKLKRGDTIAIVSLSSGLLGESFISYQREIGVKRLESMGFQVKFMPYSLKGIDYLKTHPEKRAADLKTAFADDTVKAIICAIGGDDTAFITPYLLDDPEFVDNVRKHPKIFLGFSDTTVNHLMFDKIGLNTFYGQAFLTECGELDHAMLDYSYHSLNALLVEGHIDVIEPVSTCFYERTDFGPSQIGKPRTSFENPQGYDVLTGDGVFKGKILGGCIETLYDLLVGDRYPEKVAINKTYSLLTTNTFKDKILFLESSEDKSSPQKLAMMLARLEKEGCFDQLRGLLVGKPQDDAFYEEYKTVYKSFFAKSDFSVVYNLNVGHALPRAILPFGVEVKVDAPRQWIEVMEDILK